MVCVLCLSRFRGARGLDEQGRHAWGGMTHHTIVSCCLALTLGSPPHCVFLRLSCVLSLSLSLYAHCVDNLLLSLSLFIFLMCTHQSENGAVSSRSNASSRSSATSISGPMEVSTGACVKERERKRLCLYSYISTYMLARIYRYTIYELAYMHPRTHSYIHTHTCTYTHMHTIYLPTNQLANTHTHTRAHTHAVRTPAGARARMQCPGSPEKALEYKHTYTHTYVRTCPQTYIHSHKKNIHANIHTYTHTYI